MRRLDGQGEVALPANYVREHVELAYATTAYRAQGRTVATAHALVSPTTTREVLYVSATRGREENRLYVDTCFDPDPPTSHPGLARPQSTRAVLAAVLAREGTEVSAHEAHPAGPARGGVLRRAGGRVLEHRPGRPATALRRPPRPVWVRPSKPGLGPLERGLWPAPGCRSGRRSREASTSTARYRRLAAARSLAGVDDPIAVLHARVERWAAAATSRRQANAGLIAGLIPRAQGVDDDDLARALVERDRAMERRARELAEQALAEGRAWVGSLGPAPIEPGRREAWLRAVSTVAAFRDRWELGDDPHLLGPESAVTSLEGLGHRRCAQAAVARALRLANVTAPPPAQGVVPARPELVNEGGALL